MRLVMFSFSRTRLNVLQMPSTTRHCKIFIAM
jgi:hypothetical protein